MSTENKLPRLGKAASEFNVGINTIVSLLKKKNFEIPDVNPNMKLTPEMYDILIKEFNGDRLVKEESKKIEIGSYNKVKHDQLEATHPKQEIEKDPITHVEPLKHTTPVPEEIKTEIPKPKVLGKIDLDQNNKKVTKPEEVVVEKVVEPVKEEHVVVELPKEEPIVIPEKVVVEEPVVEIPPVVESIKEEPSAPEPEVKEPIVDHVEPVVPKEPEHIETVVTKIGENIKISGKMDLSIFDKPSKKKQQEEPIVEVNIEKPETTEKVENQ